MAKSKEGREGEGEGGKRKSEKGGGNEILRILFKIFVFQSKYFEHSKYCPNNIP